jgi:hypothetical protein
MMPSADQRMGRFYAVALLAGWAVMRKWRRIGSREGSQRGICIPAWRRPAGPSAERGTRRGISVNAYRQCAKQE